MRNGDFNSQGIVEKKIKNRDNMLHLPLQTGLHEKQADQDIAFDRKTRLWP